MLGLLVNWLLDALVIFLVASLVPGVAIAGYGSALVASLVLALVSVVIGWLLLMIASILTLPAILLTFGLFFFVVRFAVNTMLLWMTSQAVSGFSINGLTPLLLASFLISFGQQIVGLVRGN